MRKKKQNVTKEKRNVRSGFEADVLDRLDGDGVTYGYETTRLPYTLQRNYIPDIVLPNSIFVELKGRFTSPDRAKILAVIKQNPGIDLRMVFMNANIKIAKNSKTRYRDWCNKNNIQWAEHRVPEDWINE